MEVGLSQAPVILREASDQEVLELALIENIQREDLNPIEEAHAFSRLAHEFGLKQEDIAQKVGKSRASIANSMRLLELHPQVRSWLTQTRISVGHAKVLLSVKSQDEQMVIAETIIRQSHTVPGGRTSRGGPLRQARAPFARTARRQRRAGPRTPRRSRIYRTAFSSTSPRTSSCGTVKNAARSRSNTTARTICSGILEMHGAAGMMKRSGVRPSRSPAPLLRGSLQSQVSAGCPGRARPAASSEESAPFAEALVPAPPRAPRRPKELWKDFSGDANAFAHVKRLVDFRPEAFRLRSP